jgi:hypothetical protein
VTVRWVLALSLTIALASCSFVAITGASGAENAQDFTPLLVPAGGAASVAPDSQDPERELASLLAHMGRVASLYTDEALSFTCEERILYRHFRFDGLEDRKRIEHELSYIYVFEEPPAGDGGDRRAGLVDYRTLLADTGPDGAREVILDDLNLPAYVLRAYSWVFLFQENLQPSYEFEITGYEDALGRDAVVLEFEAIPPYRPGFNVWCGRAWIDRETYQLLRVEATPAPHVEIKAQADHARESMRVSGRRRYEYITISTEFNEERHGMRFPSEVSLVGTAVDWRTRSGDPQYGIFREYKFVQVDQIYSEYSFFSVRTEEEIHAIVRSRESIRAP